MLRWTFPKIWGRLGAAGALALLSAFPLSGQTWLNLALDSPLPGGFKGGVNFESRWDEVGHDVGFMDLALHRVIHGGLEADGQVRLMMVQGADGGYGAGRRLAFRLIQKQPVGNHSLLRLRAMVQTSPHAQALRLRAAAQTHIYVSEAGPKWTPEVNAEVFWRRSGDEPFTGTDLRIRAEIAYWPRPTRSIFIGYQGEWAVQGSRNPGSDVLRAGWIWHCR
jgi:hypothetical protein